MNIQLLAKLVRMNYKMRKQKIIPDKWYWADGMLLKLGYYIDLNNRLMRI